MAAKKKGSEAKWFRLVPKASIRPLLAGMKIKRVVAMESKPRSKSLVFVWTVDKVGSQTKSIIIRIPMGRMCNPFTVAGGQGTKYFVKKPIPPRQFGS